MLAALDRAPCANGEQTGRTVGGVSYTLGWDYDGQLTSIAWGGNTTSFTYDALGRRCSRTAGGVTTTFHHAGSAIIVEKQGSTTTAAYTYGNSLVRKDGEVPLYDGLGSARAQTNSQQSVTATLTPDGFGQTVATTGSTTSPYGYAGDWGYRTEGDAGLMHVGARYYDAQVARFVSRDTYLTEHPYLYCEHDPVNWVDPSGHEDKALVAQAYEVCAVGAGLEVVGRYIPGPGGVGTRAVGDALVVIGVGQLIVGKLLPDEWDLPELPPVTPGELRDFIWEIGNDWDRGLRPLPIGRRNRRFYPKPDAAPPRVALVPLSRSWLVCPPPATACLVCLASSVGGTTTAL